MGSPDFGNGVSITEAIAADLHAVPKLCSSDTALLMLDRYETVYSIFNHSNRALSDARPLAIVAMHDAENATTRSPLHSRIEQYFNSDVYKYSGIALDNFLQMPTDYVEYILELSNKRLAQEGKMAANAASQLGALQGKA